MKIKRIFLDMDGVLANFVAEIAKAYGKTEEELDWNETDNSSVHVPLGLDSEVVMWEKIHGIGAPFWSGMTRYPWTDALWELCEAIAPTYIATSPSRDATSAQGKVLWLQRWKGVGFRDYVIIPRNKDFLADEGIILIDDWEKNCDKFREAGGQTILFPRLWNGNREHADKPLAYVAEWLIKMATTNS